MTTPATGRKLTDACNGVTTSFRCPAFLTPGDLKVYLLDDAGDANVSGTLLAEGDDYTIGGGSSAAGAATITTTVAYPAGKFVRRWRETSRAQGVQIVATQGVPAATQEASLDRLSLIDEEQDDDVGRAVRSLPGDSIGPIPPKADRIGKFFAFDANGDPTEASGTGNDPDFRGELGASGGAGQVGWVAGAAGAVPRTVQAKLRERGITFEDFGAVGDGVTVDRTAVVAARTAALATGAEIILVPGKNYYVGATLTDISGVGIRPGKGSIISGSIDMAQDIRPRGEALRVDINSAGIRYTVRVRPERPFAERQLRLPEGALERISGSRLDATTLLLEQVAWPAGDAWTASVPSAVTADAWTPNADTGNIWYGAFAAAKAGRTLRATFGAGTYERGILVRWNGGYIALFGTGTDCQVSIKNAGVAIATSTLTWAGLADHPQWSMTNAEFGIRVYDPATVGFLINGYEVYRANIAGVLHDVGFGVFANAGAVTPAISWITSTDEKGSFAGQQSLTFAVFGDSLSSPFASGATTSVFTGSWLESFREAIDRSPQGVKVTGWNNYAVAGHNTANMVAQFDANGVGIDNYAILLIGTDDVQQGSPLATSIANLTYVLNGINAAGRKAVVVIPPLWLNADQGADGFATSNAQYGAPLRAAFRSVALQKNALVVDLTQLTGQILTSYYADSSLSDSGVRDRIHPTDFLYDAIGHKIASAVLGHVARQITPKLGAVAIPAAWRLNGWVTTTEAAYIEVTDNGLARMFGIYDAGTKANGTVIMKTPPSLRPTTTRRFSVRTNSGAWARIDWQTNGNLILNDMPGGDTYIVLDGISMWIA